MASQSQTEPGAKLGTTDPEVGILTRQRFEESHGPTVEAQPAADADVACEEPRHIRAHIEAQRGP